MTGHILVELELDEDVIFNILSHPIRRKMLKEMFEFEGVSFSTLSKKWKISTGTIYHHLSILGPLITQDQDKLYILTEEGVKVSEWFLKSKKGKVTVRRLDAFTMLASPLINITISKTTFLLPVVTIFLSLMFYISSTMDIMIFGLFIYIAPEETSQLIILGIELGLVIASFFIYVYSSGLFLSSKTLDKRILAVYLTSLTPSAIVVLVAYILNLVGSVTIQNEMWLIISLISQVFFLLLNSSALVLFYGARIEKSALITLGNMYLIVILSQFMIN